MAVCFRDKIYPLDVLLYMNVKNVDVTSPLGGVKIVFAWKSKHGHAVMRSFEEFHLASSPSLSFGHDDLFQKEHNLCVLGLQIVNVNVDFRH